MRRRRFCSSAREGPSRRIIGLFLFLKLLNDTTLSVLPSARPAFLPSPPFLPRLFSIRVCSILHRFPPRLFPSTAPEEQQQRRHASRQERAQELRNDDGVANLRMPLLKLKLRSPALSLSLSSLSSSTFFSFSLRLRLFSPVQAPAQDPSQDLLQSKTRTSVRPRTIPHSSSRML